MTCIFFLQEIPQAECTDGVCVLNGVRYFKCSPNRGYFCQLGQLVPRHSNNMICNSKLIFISEVYMKMHYNYVRVYVAMYIFSSTNVTTAATCTSTEQYNLKMPHRR